MSDKVEFDLYSILAVTHRLPSTARQFRTILAHILGVEIDQVPGAGLAALTVAPDCALWLLEQHPQLRNIPAPPDFDGNEEAMDVWAAKQAEVLGTERLLITPIPPNRSRRDSLGDVLDTIADIRGDLNTIVIVDPTKPDFGLGKPSDD